MVDHLSTEQKEDIMRRAFQLEVNIPVPILVQPFGKWYATRANMEDWAADLAHQTERYREQQQVYDFSLPHLMTGMGLGSIAASFGAESIWDDEADAWIKPLVTTDPRAVYDLQLPDPHTSGLNPTILNRIEYFQEHGEFPLEPGNIASPLTTASYVWEYSEMLYAITEYPAQVHHLLELVTQATIDYVRTQTERIDNLFALSHEDWYIPIERGIRVSDDVLAVLGPAHYEEFGVRYNNILAREFGGISVHSCGSIVHQIPTILKTENLTSIDLTLPHNDPAALADVTAGRVALTMRYWLQDWDDWQAPDLEEYTDRVIELFGTRGIMLQMETPTLPDAIELSRRLRQKPWSQ